MGQQAIDGADILLDGAGEQVGHIHDPGIGKLADGGKGFQVIGFFHGLDPKVALEVFHEPHFRIAEAIARGVRMVIVGNGATGKSQGDRRDAAVEALHFRQSFDVAAKHEAGIEAQDAGIDRPDRAGINSKRDRGLAGWNSDGRIVKYAGRAGRCLGGLSLWPGCARLLLKEGAGGEEENGGETGEDDT